MSIFELMMLVFTWQNLLALVIGGFVGLIVGILPGLALPPGWPCPSLWS